MLVTSYPGLAIYRPTVTQPENKIRASWMYVSALVPEADARAEVPVMQTLVCVTPDTLTLSEFKDTSPTLMIPFF